MNGCACRCHPGKVALSCSIFGCEKEMVVIQKMLSAGAIAGLAAISAVLWAGPQADGPMEVSPDTYLSGVVAELMREWPANRTVNVACHGHSVPAGYFRTPVVDTFSAYPHLLHRGLKERFPYAVVNVIVTAVGGENSEGGAKRFERDVLSLRPDVVTIDYGLNDRGIGLARAEAAWQAMIARAQAAGVKVILLTPTPDMGVKLDDPNDPIHQHARQIRALARKNGVALVDSLAGFEKRIRAGEPLDGLMSQINHPNRKGHEIVAAELLHWFPAPPGGADPAEKQRTAEAGNASTPSRESAMSASSTLTGLGRALPRRPALPGPSWRRS
jgi:acyl-CoA thioesterase-1